MKKILRIVLGLIYLAALFFSVAILLKPGAALFYWKSQIEANEIVREGDAYAYRFQVNQRVFDADTLLVLEDQQILEAATAGFTGDGAAGTFAIKETGQSGITVLFVPTAPSDPATNGRTYRIFIRPHLFSSNWGGKAVLLLLLGGFAFVRPGLFSASPLVTTPRRRLIRHAAVDIVLIAFFYVFMEWVFFVTKPSFMDILSLGEKVKILLLTGLAAALLALLALPVILLVDVVLTPFSNAFRSYGFFLPPAFLGACLSLILIDNFTYTVFGFGIVFSRTLVRLVYALIFFGIFFSILSKMAVSARSGLADGSSKVNALVAFAVCIPALIVAGIAYQPANRDVTLAREQGGANRRPNIIFLSTDGLNAGNMSVYGYERDTTPFIAQLAQNSLVSENHFTNAAHSMGSDTALLTGKLPLKTRVLYPPDTLKESDAYQHLPGILRREGYRTVSLGVPYYVDVNTINFLNAFDAVNCQENVADSLSSRLSGYGYDDAVYLFTTITGRIRERLGHILFIQDMENPFTLVTQEVSDTLTDQQRLECLWSDLERIKRTGQPLFAHIHLMATHGPKFSPAVQVFSRDKVQDQLWMTDFYDDAVLNFDRTVQQLVEHLKGLDLYDDTILVLYTDHGQQYSTVEKLPLILHFPGNQHAGILTENTQNLDVAPTILDYLGLPVPEWMDGSSLLDELDPKRLIIAAYARNISQTSGRFALNTEALKPPFYQFGGITVIQCQKAYTINLVDMNMSVRDVENYRGACSEDRLDPQDVVRGQVGRLLEQYGYHLPANW